MQWHQNGQKASQLCILSVYDGGRKEWIAKCDGAENTDIEPIKGGISDSFKRAAVLWGIGRYLYSLEGVWVELKDGKYIVDGEYRKLDAAYEKAVTALTGEAPPKASARQRATAPPEAALSGQQPKAESKPVIQFDFAVKSATPKNFASGKGFVLSLAPAKKGVEVTAYLQGEHPDIASGVCLKNVQLTQAPGAVAGSSINILVEREELRQICAAVGLEYSQSARTTDTNAFRSATGDIYDRVVDGTQIYKVFCRDKERQGSVISRELVKETLGATTNHYIKLANLALDTDGNYFSYDNVSYDPVVNPYGYCEQAETLFEKYKRCAGRKQIETLAMNFLDQMQAIKISIHGRLYFVPQTHMQEVTLFENFIEALNVHNQSSTPLVVNSMYVMNDEKLRKKMAAEFYNAVKKEIEEYQERAEHLISTDSQSPAIMGRWVLKIEALEQKKQEYECILRQQLDELNDEFATLRMFSQELQVRSRKLERQRAA